MKLTPLVCRTSVQVMTRVCTSCCAWEPCFRHTSDILMAELTLQAVSKLLQRLPFVPITLKMVLTSDSQDSVIFKVSTIYPK